jgi:hypothetical protein
MLCTVLAIVTSEPRGLFDGVLVAGLGGALAGFVIGLIKGIGYVLSRRSSSSVVSTPPPEGPAPTTSTPGPADSHAKQR